MRTTLVVPGLASGGPMVTSAARCDVLPRVLKKFFHARVRSFVRLRLMSNAVVTRVMGVHI